MRTDILNKICEVILENKEVLAELDSSIGDSDHGINLSRGILKLKDEITNFENLKPFEALNKCAMIIMSNVGGASGALYASALMKGAMYLKNKDSITNEDICNTWQQMIVEIESKGKSTTGEKTMLDTLVPAYSAFKEKIINNKNLKEAFIQASKAAKKGMESTKNMLAKKGRASYLGDRSIGHIDPGAMSSYLIIKSIAETI